MPTWVNAYEKLPSKPSLYFCRANGYKHLLSLEDMLSKMIVCETFLWLDESDEDKKTFAVLYAVKTMDDFCKTDYEKIAKFNAKYNPLIRRSFIINSIRRFYLKQIAQLKNENSILIKELRNKNINGNSYLEKSWIDPLIEKIKQINASSYF